ncbi:hypothetical protein ACFQJ5_05490 [Halomicroarcula sp. GCM10025324]|uniref:hypothetical protein n=1 Tax=Haloarcula TaxID=2237 RepID=UPI0023E8F004|nr:hypothetical protein [Halomicroarcula sp. ZS-22-S1]
MNLNEISRRKALKLVGVGGVIVVGTGVTSAHRDDVDPQQLNELREATAKYHDLENALTDGFVLPEDHCVSSGDPDVGAMGFHYVHLGRLDETLDHTEPEVLLYEERGNKRHLVAVEFLSTATSKADGGEPPVVLGHEMHPFHEPFANWALHVWAWKDNPNGLFADFNPRVECPE